MLYILDIHWKRRVPQDGKASAGIDTVPVAACSLTRAKNKAIRRFNSQVGQTHRVISVEEKPDPAEIFR